MSIFNSGGYGNQQRQAGGCLNLRFIIGVVIAGIGLLSYLTHTEVNPVTGEKQHIAMSVDQEMQLGLQAAPDMVNQMGGLVDPSDRRAQLVNAVGHHLLDRSDARRGPYTDNFHFSLLRDPQTINAFSLPGGQVFITAALFDRLENEAQLAGVLGHEIGHVIGRHGAEHMATGQLGQMLVTAVAVGASNDRDNRGQLAAMAAMMANQVLQLKYSRNDEFQADQFGLQFMAQTGYDPREMHRVMEILKASAGSSGRGPSIFATHPDPDARIDRIEAYLKDNYPSGIPGNLITGASLKSEASMNLER
ncbi:M48 family metallopeptidase [soil metagenome]